VCVLLLLYHKQHQQSTSWYFLGLLYCFIVQLYVYLVQCVMDSSSFEQNGQRSELRGLTDTSNHLHLTWV